MTTVAQVLMAVNFWLARGVGWVWMACNVIGTGVSLWALVDCLTRQSAHFIAADKRTKGFWLVVTGLGLVVVVLTGWASMLGLLGVVAGGVYLADVRPALSYYRPVRVRSQVRRASGKRGRGTRGGGR